MPSTNTIAYQIGSHDDSLSGTGNWLFGEAGPAPALSSRAQVTRRIPRIAGIALLTAVSSVTAFSDPWAEVAQQRAQLTMSRAFQPYTRRRVTPAEARTLALEIMRRAEAEREKFAQGEAQHGIDWEETA